MLPAAFWQQPRAWLRVRLEWVIAQKWLNLGLRGKMSMMVVVGLLGLLTVFALLGAATAKQSVDRVLDERVALAQLTAHKLDSSLQQAGRLLALVAQHQGLAHPSPVVQAEALAVAEQALHGLSRGVWLLDAAGTQIATSRPDLPEPEWQGIAVAGPNPVPGPIVELLPEPAPSALIAVPVADAAGRPAGRLAARLDLAHPELAPFEAPYNLGEAGAIHVVDATGNILLSSQQEPAALNSNALRLVRELFAGNTARVETCPSCFGAEPSQAADDVLAFAPLEAGAWGVLVRQPAAEVFAATRQLTLRVLILGVLTIAGALGLVWVTTSSVIQPVQVLSAAAGRIARGDLDTPLTLRQTDEIGGLAADFELMRQHLKQSHDEKEAWNRELDARVRERTQALSRRNQQLAILNTIASTVNQSLQLEAILGQALDEVLRLTGVDFGAIFLVEDEAGRLELKACRGLSAEAARLAAQMGMLDSSCGGVLDKLEVVVVPDVGSYRGRRAQSLQRENVCWLMHVPLVAQGEALGSMCVGMRESSGFDADEKELLLAIASQIAVAVDNARLYAEVQRKEFVRGELFRKAIEAQEDERRRIARELHDDTSQALTALLYAVEAGCDSANDPATKAQLDGMRQLVQHTLDGVHKVIFDLRPSMLDHLGLVPALRRFAESRLEARGIQVTIDAPADPERLPPEVETALFRVMQEAILNIARHSGARHARLVMRFEPDQVCMLAEDDGVGFDVLALDLSPDSAKGLGLMGMRERIGLLGGRVTLDTAPGQGTRLTFSVPIGRAGRVA